MLTLKQNQLFRYAVPHVTDKWILYLFWLIISIFLHILSQLDSGRLEFRCHFVFCSSPQALPIKYTGWVENVHKAKLYRMRHLLSKLCIKLNFCSLSPQDQSSESPTFTKDLESILLNFTLVSLMMVTRTLRNYLRKK